MTNNPLLPHLIQHYGAQAINVLVQRDDRVVARVRQGDGDFVVKIDAATAAFEHEAAAMQTLISAGIPVSKLIEADPGPPARLVVTWADGVPIAPSTDPGVLREVGAILRRVHALPATGPWSAHPTMAGWIAAWIGIIAAWWRDLGADGTQIAAMWAWLEEVRPLLDDEYGSQMLFDGRPEHFLVDDRRQLHLIDVADLQVGDPVMDLAVLELDAPGILPPVLVGYAPSVAERERIDQLVPFYVMLRALSGAEWQTRVGGNRSLVERNLAIARRTVEARRKD